MVTGYPAINLIIKIDGVIRYVLAPRLYLTILKILKFYLRWREYNCGLLGKKIQAFLSGFLLLGAGELPVSELHHDRDDNRRAYC